MCHMELKPLQITLCRNAKTTSVRGAYSPGKHLKLLHAVRHLAWRLLGC